MGRLIGPSIVTNGLIGFWDAGNAPSYPGSGTNWSDLSGNRNNGTMSGGTRTYSSSNKGILTFSGAVTTLASAINLTGDFTISWWENLSGVIDSNNGPFGGSTSGANHFVGYLRYYTGTFDAVVNNVKTYHSTWYYYTLRRIGTSYSIYTDGANLTGSATNSAVTVPIETLARAGASGSMTGSLSMIKIYNRGLSEAEITQNFNASRQRFVDDADNTTGLIGFWDAGNASSYSGSGDTWSDISGSGNHATMSAGTRTYSSSNGGTLFFSGATVTLASTINLTGDFTINWWENLSGTIGANQGIVGLSGAGNDINHFGGKVRYWNGGTFDLVINDSNTSAEVWYNYAITRVGSIYKVYSNGVTTGSSSTSVSTFSITHLARGAGGSMTGYLPILKIYNRGLSSADINKNFNDTRGRFGI